MARAGLDAAAVVSAAAEMVDVDGLEALTLTGLATRLGVRPPSLYAHVGGLEDLRRRLATLSAERLHDALAPAVAGRAGPDALRAVLSAYRQFARAHPGLYAAAQLAGTSGVAPAAAGSRVVEVMRAVMLGYGLEGETAVHAVRSVRSAVHGFLALAEGGGFGMDVDVEASWTWMVALLDRGLAEAGAGG